MVSTMRRTILLTTIAVAAVMSPILGARAQPPTPVSTVAAIALQYVPGDVRAPFIPVEMVEGGMLVFSNLDPLDWHNITSYGLDERGDFLFESELLGQGQSEILDGVDRLSPGDYRFHCRIHTGMDGVLRIVP